MGRLRRGEGAKDFSFGGVSPSGGKGGQHKKNKPKDPPSRRQKKRKEGLKGVGENADFSDMEKKLCVKKKNPRVQKRRTERGVMRKKKKKKKKTGKV